MKMAVLQEGLHSDDTRQTPRYTDLPVTAHNGLTTTADATDFDTSIQDDF